MTACVSDNELVEYAEGLLAAEHARDVARHVEDCDACRRVLAGIAASGPTEELPSPSAKTTLDAPREEEPTVLPRDLLLRYLRKDARQREMSASKILLLLAVPWIILITIVLVFAPVSDAVETQRLPQLRFVFVVLGTVIAYHLVLFVRLRRGWFHPAVPMVNSLVEVSIASAFLLRHAFYGPLEAVTSPFLLLIGGMIVFTAIRAEPKVSLVCGIVASAEQLGIYLLARAQLPDTTLLAASSLGMAFRVVIMLFCGAAGATLARHFIRQAQGALREIREQDMFGKYLLHERLGVGGMAEVFRATYCPEGGFVSFPPCRSWAT